MVSGVASCFIFFFHALFVFQFIPGNNCREIHYKNSVLDLHGHKEVHNDQSNQMKKMDPRLKIFFKIIDIKLGNKLPVYFSIKNTSTSTTLLSRDQVDSIPFSTSQISHILRFFSLPSGSPQAKAMADTLRHCEYPAMQGETKFCATSLESLLDSITSIFGSTTPIKVLTTTYITNPKTHLQNYTIVKIPKEISAPRIVGCHPLSYPYAVFYCHSQKSDNKLYKVLLRGDDGAEIDAVAMCHLDTSQWNHDHVAFSVLNVEPGSCPVCHFFPADNLVWIPSSAPSI